MVDGRLHPALNLISARLISGQASNPTFVKAAELDKYPQGPMVGIVGAPTQMPIRTGLDSQWAVCDTAPTATADDLGRSGAGGDGDRRAAERGPALGAAGGCPTRSWPATTTRRSWSGTATAPRST